MYRCLTRWGLPLLLVFFGVFDLVLATVVEPPSDKIAGIILGFTFAQVTLLAVWAALGPARVFARMATGLVIAVFVSLCLFACFESMGRSDISIVLGGVVLALWGVIQLPLWMSRLFFGWRLCWPGEETLEQGDETQFGIRQLFAWTALVAITLGIGRWLVSSDVGNQWRNPWQAIAVFGVLTVFNALLVHSG